MSPSTSAVAYPGAYYMLPVRARVSTWSTFSFCDAEPGRAVLGIQLQLLRDDLFLALTSHKLFEYGFYYDHCDAGAGDDRLPHHHRQVRNDEISPHFVRLDQPSSMPLASMRP